TWDYPEKGKPYFERAFQLSERLTEKDKLYITGWYAIANKDFTRAAETFRAIVNDYPFEVEAYARLAKLLEGEGQYEDAGRILKQGLTIDPEAKNLYNLLGGIYSVLGRHDDAIAMARRYVELAPDEPNAHDTLGLIYQWAGRYGEAVAEYERALALKPEFEVAVIHLGNTYFQLGRYREASEKFERYIQLARFDEGRARGYSSLVYLYLKKKDLPRAQQAARQIPKGLRLWSEFFLALDRGQMANVERLQARLSENYPSATRGAASTLRDLYYMRGALSFNSGRK